MSRSVVARVAAAAIGAALVVAAAAPAHAEDPLPGRIVGHFTTYGSGTAVADAYVSVVDSSWSEVGFAITDATGAFEVADLVPGDYKIRFSVEFESQWYHQKADFESADPVTVAAGADTVVEEQTLPTGTLEVTVADSVTGQPIPGACVEASGAGSACSPTGVVTFTGLVVGTYELSANADELYLFGSGEGTVIAGETTSVTIRLDPAAAIGVRARDAATGAPVAGVCVRAVPMTKAGLPAEPSGDCTGADGQVTVGRLPAGDYRILAAPQDGVHGLQWVGARRGTGTQERAATLRASAGSVTAAPAVRLDRAGSIAGTVTEAATGAPIADVCTLPFAFGPSGGPDTGERCTGADGRFVLRGLGPYAWPVEFVDFSGRYAWQWSGGSAHRLAAAPVRVRAGRVAREDARLVAGARATGLITGPDGQPRFASAWAYNTVSGDYAAAYGPTDETGAYTVGGLAAQDVKVQATPAIAGGMSTWYRDATSFATASPISVPAGGTVVGIDLTLPD